MNRPSIVTRTATWLSGSFAIALIVAVGTASILGRTRPGGFIDAAELVGIIGFAVGTPIFSLVGWRTAGPARPYVVANQVLLTIWLAGVVLAGLAHM
jgi:hypothetical protein